MRTSGLIKDYSVVDFCNPSVGEIRELEPHVACVQYGSDYKTENLSVGWDGMGWEEQGNSVLHGLANQLVDFEIF